MKVSDARSQGRWLPVEAVDELLTRRPALDLADRIQAAGIEATLTAAEDEAVRFLDIDLPAEVAALNEEITLSELSSRRAFFESIETSPLTDEQARAVVCFDNRVQVLAAAGSGKTSVMVARAAYAVSRRFISPDRVLLLAFNRAAADELQKRVDTRFAAAGIDSAGVRASTFHAFGLNLLALATGEKPRLASWLDHGQDVRMIERIVDELRDRSSTFRYQWDLYRMLFANAPTDLQTDEPDEYDSASARGGYRTFGGEIVRSHGERLIANFLYLNGINYLYEKPYDIKVADAGHSAYRPDFYYPDIDVWHEHWALDRDGEPPDEFVGYAEGMAWKRDLHARHGSTLVESTWADVMFDDGLSKLESDLTRLGLTFNWNPDRPPRDKWAKPVTHESLARMMRSFMIHVKSNSLTAEDLDGRLVKELRYLNGYRTRLFLNLHWQIRAEWDRRLAAEGSVDFEDMLIQAADYLEKKAVDCEYDLIMVDEFQDASRARARLVQGLLQSPGRFLLAVGDDWQSINRFAGADLSVMTDFESWFGRGPQLELTTTFRCTQTICDVAREFIARNPSQFTKPMQSVFPDPGPAVTVITTRNPGDALASHLKDLSTAVAEGALATGPDGTVSVDVLGRYRFEREVLPQKVPNNLNVTFRTVHGSKGLEADYIVIPGMNTGTYGFPSTIADDPVLSLALPKPEDFAHAEERRLLYVALTRARRQVTLITQPDRMSPFVVELLASPHVIGTGEDHISMHVCDCGKGVMVRREGKYGPFLGCSTFPACRHTRSLPDG